MKKQYSHKSENWLLPPQLSIKLNITQSDINKGSAIASRQTYKALILSKKNEDVPTECTVHCIGATHGSVTFGW